MMDTMVEIWVTIEEILNCRKNKEFFGSPYRMSPYDYKVLVPMESILGRREIEGKRSFLTVKVSPSEAPSPAKPNGK